MSFSLPLALVDVPTPEINLDPSLHLSNFGPLSPLLIIIGGVLLILLVDILFRGIGHRALPSSGHFTLGAATALAALLADIWLLSQHWNDIYSQAFFQATGPPGSSDPRWALQRGWTEVGPWRGGALLVDNTALMVMAAASVILLMTLCLLWPHLRRLRVFRSELVPLLLLSTSGVMLLGLSRDLIVTFIAIEVLSLPLYVLCGMDERREASREASLKYFLLGAFSSGFFIYGAALLYASCGHLNYTAIQVYFNSYPLAAGLSPVALIGLALVGVGLAFKLALVPFQAWVPDVYQGAPTPVTAFMATAVKLGVFIATMRFIQEVLYAVLDPRYWRTPLMVFAVASMVIGNFFALHQTSLKRLLAYSAITHTGYLTLALCTGIFTATPGLLAYLLAYYLASFGAFALVSYLAPTGQDDVYLDELHELSRRAPAASGLMVVLLLSMVGMPFTAGFIGKLLVFTNAWREGLHGLVIVAVLNSVVSAYFYLRVILAMYMQPKVPGATELALPKMEWGYLYPLAITAALTLVLGMLPELLVLLGYGRGFI